MVKLMIDGVTQGALGLPVPLPQPRRSRVLPKRFVLEVAEDEVRVLDGDAGVLERWPRGAVDARIRLLDERDVQLDLRWPDQVRRAGLYADAAAETVAVAELLAQDTRLAHGLDEEADAAFTRLAAETLPEALRRERGTALRGVAVMLQPGERPLVVAGADRGLSFGIALLTDRALLWWAGGRKASLAIPREEIAAAAVERVELVVEDVGGRRSSLGDFDPAERAREIAELLVAALPEPAAPHPFDVLVEATGEKITWHIRHDLELVRELWEEGERGLELAIGIVGSRRGALVVTDRRLLWVSRKADPIAIGRADVAAGELGRRLGLTRLELTLTGGETRRIDAIEPSDRAALILAALGLGA